MNDFAARGFRSLGVARTDENGHDRVKLIAYRIFDHQHSGFLVEASKEGK